MQTHPLRRKTKAQKTADPAPDICPHCGGAINAASLLAKRPSPARVASARRAATFPRPSRRKTKPQKSLTPARLNQ
jgi:hypothetical protein